MAKARALDKRRQSIRNIRKITRTMELIATARFKRAMDRATAAADYTRRVARVVADLSRSGLEVSHPLLERREPPRRSALLVLTSNRGLCGGYNGAVLRVAVGQRATLLDQSDDLRVEVAGKRGVSGLKFRRITVHQSYTQFEDQPRYEDVERIADNFIEMYSTGELDRLDVVYTRFYSSSRQTPVVETLLPMEPPVEDAAKMDAAKMDKLGTADKDVSKWIPIYEFTPSPESILEEIVPTSFKVRLFQCFLDAAVSEQIARMVAMKNATQNANEMIRSLSSKYNRARQSQITSEIMEVIGGVEALNA